MRVTWFDTKRYEAEVDIAVETLGSGWREHEQEITEALSGLSIKDYDKSLVGTVEREIDHVEEIAKDQPVPSDVKAVRYVPEF